MATKKSAEATTMIEIPGINTETIVVKVEGTSPLITNAWSKKAKEMLLGKQMKKASSGREAKDPFRDFCESMYWLDGMPASPTEEDVQNARFGFPAVGFKSAAIDGAYQSGRIPKKTTARGSFFILGEMVEIIGHPQMREDMCKIGMGIADVRYRAEFKEWSAYLHIEYDRNATSPEILTNMLNIGGFSNGVGEWRPARDGDFGRFRVVEVGEAAA